MPAILASSGPMPLSMSYSSSLHAFTVESTILVNNADTADDDCNYTRNWKS